MEKINKYYLYSLFQYHRIKRHLSYGYYVIGKNGEIKCASTKTKHYVNKNSNPSVDKIGFGGFKKVFIFYKDSNYIRIIFFNRKQMKNIINAYDKINYPLIKIVNYNFQQMFIDIERINITPRDYSFDFSKKISFFIGNRLSDNYTKCKLVKTYKKSIAYKIGITDYFCMPQHGDLHNGNIVLRHNNYVFIDLDYVGNAPLLTDQISLFTSCYSYEHTIESFLTDRFFKVFLPNIDANQTNIIGKYLILFLLNRIKKSILYGSSKKSILYDYDMFYNSFISHSFDNYPYVKEGLLILKSVIQKPKRYILKHLL